MSERYVVFWLDEKKVLQKFKECRNLAGALERISCSLDSLDRQLQTPERPELMVQALEDIRRAAVVVKTRHGVPEDKAAYGVEKGARDLIERVRKSGLDEKGAERLRKSVGLLREKASLLEERVPNVCGLRTFEGIAKPPKE